MLVRLAVDWIDPFGVTHGPGELVDVDAVTLAELEQHGMVETMSDDQPEKWIGPGSPEPDKWIGPGSPTPDEPATDPDSEPQE